ncbi:MAG: hypothetical protein ABI743_10930, partial [bacterium]
TAPWALTSDAAQPASLPWRWVAPALLLGATLNLGWAWLPFSDPRCNPMIAGLARLQQLSGTATLFPGGDYRGPGALPLSKLLVYAWTWGEAPVYRVALVPAGSMDLSAIPAGSEFFQAFLITQSLWETLDGDSAPSGSLYCHVGRVRMSAPESCLIRPAEWQLSGEIELGGEHWLRFEHRGANSP